MLHSRRKRRNARLLAAASLGSVGALTQFSAVGAGAPPPTAPGQGSTQGGPSLRRATVPLLGATVPLLGATEPLLGAALGYAPLSYDPTAFTVAAPPVQKPNPGPDSVQAFGSARGLASSLPAGSGPVVGMARAHPRGYWLVTAKGGVYSFGGAAYLGSMAGKAMAAPVVGMAAVPGGGGYWLVGSNGEVFSFGDAAYLGSMAGKAMAAPVVGMAAVPGGGGYWLVGSNGEVFSFGDARFFGSMSGKPLDKPIVGITPTSGGGGYWLAASDGGVFSFGDAPFAGSVTDATSGPFIPVVAIAGAARGAGYRVATALDPPPPPAPAPKPATTGDAPATPRAAVASQTPSGNQGSGNQGPGNQGSGNQGSVPLGTFVVTCYSQSGTTASGMQTSTAVVSVDPSVIPLGTHIYIAGVGNRIAADTGGAIKGKRLDIWEPSTATCINFGVQSMQVWRTGGTAG
ncbi:MAG: 3D domain-containing protein [Acidimicrobiales bacterium]